MHSIAKAFSRERDKQCPTCGGSKRVYMDGKYLECYHCSGKGSVKHVD